ncbi:MAG: hypothetical protein WB116_11750 [Candidatus Dormiibacterota bacterium]
MATSSCQGSGLLMVYRSFLVRQIDASDRAKWEGWAQAEEERGEFEAAQGTRDFLQKWEAEQGQSKEELVCPICGEPVVEADRQRHLSAPHPLGRHSAIVGSGASTSKGHSGAADRTGSRAGLAGRAY